MLFMHNESGLATRLSVSPSWYCPRPGVGAADPRSTPHRLSTYLSLSDCASMSDIAWLTSSFDKLSSLYISFIIINKWSNSVMSRDRSATVRSSRRAEHFKSFSIAISTQSRANVLLSYVTLPFNVGRPFCLVDVSQWLHNLQPKHHRVCMHIPEQFI